MLHFKLSNSNILFFQSSNDKLKKKLVKIDAQYEIQAKKNAELQILIGWVDIGTARVVY